MINLDEDALICDLAEVYHIYDYRSLPADLVATYAVGLRDSSRIKSKLSNMMMPLDDYLMAAIFDAVNWLCWTHTKDAGKGGRPPERILDILQDKKKEEKPEDDFIVFDSPEEFEQARMRLLGEQDG